MEPPVIGRLLALLAEREDEQATVSRMLHDDAGQVLSAIGLHLDVLRSDLPTGQQEQVVEIQKLLEHVISRIRVASQALNANFVERAGLGFALEQLVAKARDRAPESTIRLLITPGNRWPNGPAHAAYRAAEAALDNALRHSGSPRIELRMQGGTLEIRDEGKGFNPETNATGLGLRLSQYLAERAGLVMIVNSSAGQGTIVKLTLHGL